jgi:hypothetical protein
MKILILLYILVSSSMVFACKSSDLSIDSIDPISGDKFTLKVSAYIPDVNANKQVVILPPIGGITTLEAKYASRVCARGVPAFVFVHWSGDMEQSIEDLGVHERGTVRCLHALESFFESYSLPTRILGTSLGGVYAGIASGKFNLIEKTVIIASGTNLPEIMAKSTLPDLIKLKEERFNYHGFLNEDEYSNAIKDKLSIEAINYKDNFKGKKLLFIRTNSDSVIKPVYQDQLIKLFDKEESSVIYTKYGHRRGIIMAFLRRAKRISNFLAN